MFPAVCTGAVGSARLSFAHAQITCPDKNIKYWQGFPPGGESDLSARHQQLVLKKKCPAIDTIIQYKAGAGGGLLWAQMNTLPGDGYNVVGINLPHIVLQPMEGQVSYKTDDVTPVFWFHYTPDASSSTSRARSRLSPTSSRRKETAGQAQPRRLGPATRPTTPRTRG